MRERGLSAAGFAHQRDHLPPAERERHAVDRAEQPFRLEKTRAHPIAARDLARFQQGWRGLHRAKHGYVRCRRFDDRRTIGQYAAKRAGVVERPQRHGLRRAGGSGEAAAVAKMAAAEITEQAWHCPRNGLQHCSWRRAPGDGNRGQQRLRVRMQRPRKQRRRRRRLHHLARVHHQHASCNACDDAEIVGDQDQRHLEAMLQPHEQVQDLCLDSHVERSGGLVCDQQFRLRYQRHCDHDALAQPAGELMRILPQPRRRRGDAHCFEHLQCAVPRRVRGCSAVPPVRLLQLVADREGGIERGHRLLEDHRHSPPADIRHAAFVELTKIVPTEAQCCDAPARRARQQPHQGERGE